MTHREHAAQADPQNGLPAGWRMCMGCGLVVKDVQRHAATRTHAVMSGPRRDTVERGMIAARRVLALGELRGAVA